VFDEPLPMAEVAPPPAPPAPPAPAVADRGASEDLSYRKLRPPRYPPSALRRHEEGEVTLRVLVGIDGTPIRIEVEKSSRSRDLDQAAIEAVKQWRFNPSVRDGRAVEGWALVPISFKLNEG
jgi:protein TonB